MNPFKMVRAMQFYHLSRKGAVLLIGVVLAKSAVPLEDIGLYESLMFLAMAFSFFWVESIIKAYLTLFHEWETIKKSSSIFSLYALYLAISAVIALSLWFLETPIAAMFTGGEPLSYMTWLALYLLLYQPTAIVAFVLQLQEKLYTIVVWSLWNAMGFLSAVILPVVWGQGIEGVVKGLVVFAAVSHIIGVVLLSLDWRVRLKKGIIQQLLVLSGPLVLYAIIQSFAGLFDAWLVQNMYEDLESFALFRYGARELPIVIPLAVGVSNLALPLLTVNLNEGLDLLAKESSRLMHLIFPLAIVLIMSSFYLFEWVYSPEFRTSAALFNVYLFLIIPQLIFPQTVYLAKKDTTFLVRVGMVEVVLNVVLSLYWVQFYGMVGIAWATVCAFIVEKTILMYYAYTRHQVRPLEYLPWKTLMLYAVLLITAYLWIGNYESFLMH